MRKNRFTPLLIILLLATLGIVGYFVYNNVLEKSFFWKTTKGRNISFQISYPSSWFNCAEVRPDAHADIDVTSDSSNCYDAAPHGPSVRFFQLNDTGETSTKTDVKDYLKDAENKFWESEEAKTPPGMPMLPTAPGFTWNFENYENNLLCIKNASVAKVRGMGFPTYIILYKSHVYELGFSPTTGLSSIPLRIMLCSLRLP